jgi:hypothetical protein
MGRMKLDRPRKALNTTIDEEYLNDFREYCDYLNIPMNIILELFMKQFVERQFQVSLIKGEKYILFDENK